MKSPTDVYTLSNGVGIPCLGFGTWQTPNGEVAVSSVKCALEIWICGNICLPHQFHDYLIFIETHAFRNTSFNDFFCINIYHFFQSITFDLYAITLS